MVHSAMRAQTLALTIRRAGLSKLNRQESNALIDPHYMYCLSGPPDARSIISVGVLRVLHAPYGLIPGRITVAHPRGTADVKISVRRAREHDPRSVSRTS